MSHQNKITTHTYEKINDYMRFQQQTTVYSYIAGSKQAMFIQTVVYRDRQWPVRNIHVIWENFKIKMETTTE